MPKEIGMNSSKRKSPYPRSSSTSLKRKKSSSTRNTEDGEATNTSINDLKRRIRDARRLLRKPDLPADKRIIQERALRGYEKELADEEARRERSKMIKKYHFVRFLDRKTATKEVKHLSRKHEELAKSTDTEMDEKTKEKKLAKLAQRVHTAKVNLNYTIYYPLTQKYISIYAEKKKTKEVGHDAGADQEEEEEEEEIEDGDDDPGSSTAAERAAMWHVVEKCMEDGTLDLLREGKLDLNDERNSKAEKSESIPKGASDKKSSKKSSKKKGENSNVKPSRADTRREKHTRYAPPVRDDEDDESDGGFFEM
ncbi:Efg1 domain-containing protein [Aspergillus lucknowensis]|uniref:rRNA-processing protein EFG1 n=1 Tax=Aspergillus lucknowensis TaxID=176173 RepID=A0ABR4LWB1_9EURO